MSDLLDIEVQRLRDERDHFWTESERLRAENEGVKTVVRELAKTVQILRDGMAALLPVVQERDRYREALEKIAMKGIDRHAVNPSTKVELGAWSIPAGWDPAEHARAALAGAGKDGEG